MKEHQLLLMLFLCSFILLFSFSIRIEDFVNNDAMRYGENAKNIVMGKPYSSIGWIDRPLEFLRDFGEIPYTLEWPGSSLYALVVAFFFSIFGVSFDSIKYVGVLFGSLSVLATYYLARQFLSKNSSLLAFFLMITYPLFIHHSIVPGNEVFTSFFVAITLYFTILKDTKKNLIMRGIFSGLTFMARDETGILILLSLLLAYSIKNHSHSLKKRLKDISLILVSFTMALSGLIYYNYSLFHCFIRLPSIFGKILFGGELMPLLQLRVIISPLVYTVIIFALLLFFCFLSNAIKLSQKLVHKCEPNKIRVIAFVIVIPIIFLISNNFNFQRIYDHSPILCILGLTGIAINFKEIKKFYPIYTFLFLSIITYSISSSDLGTYSQSRYTIMSLPILVIFATSATSKIISLFSQSKSRKTAVLVLISSIVLLSSLTNYGILTQSIAIKGPFKRRNLDKAYNWVANNIDENETVIAIWPTTLFYANRRTITLLPKLQYTNSELFTVINYGQVSYIVICWDMRHMITNPLMTDLYNNPRDVEGFKLMYQVGTTSWADPQIVIYKIILNSE